MSVVTTRLGAVQGYEDGGLHVFRGIPYAETTAGEGRFRAPRPKAPWPGVLSALEPRAVAPQLHDVAYEMSGASVQHLCSEDCLELNIWTPAVDDARRPVMVYIHGGGFLYGSGHDVDYDGAALARTGDVVVVTLNYRLGIFGQLFLREVGGEDFANSGNLATMDQIEALRWVNAHIEHFGGDPGAVTIFGESAGGLSVAHLMLSPMAKGLFQRTIAMSGNCKGRSLTAARRVTGEIMAKAGAKTVAELQVLSMRELLDLQAWALAELAMAEGTFMPVVGGGPVLPRDTFEMLAEGAGADIDLMIGYTKDEARYWELYYPGMLDQSAALVRDWAAEVFGAAGPKVLDAYSRIRKDEKPGERACSIIGDVVYTWVSYNQARLQSRHNPKTWMYRMDWQTAMLEGRLGAPHATELPFVFDSFGTQWGEMIAPDDHEEREGLLRACQGAFLAFARTGDPNHSGMPRWRAFDEQTRSVMMFDRRSHCEDDPFHSELALWRDVIGTEKLSDVGRYFRFPTKFTYPTGAAVDETAKQIAVP